MGMRSLGRRALLLLLLTAGCDTLEARQIANHAAADYKKGLLRKAAEKYEDAAKLDASIPEVQLNLGFTYLSMLNEEPSGSTERQKFGSNAIAHFKNYIQLRPEDPRGRNFLVQAFVDAKRYAEAKEYFRAEIEKDPPSLEIITIMSEIAAKLGQLDDALALIQKRAELKPDDPNAHLALGVLAWDHLHRHPEIPEAERIALADRGIEALQRATKLSPNATEPLTYINLVYRQRALAHPCEKWDGGFADAEVEVKRGRKKAPVIVSDIPDSGLPDQGTLEECETLRKADLAEADRYYAQAKELMKLTADAGAADAGKGK